jgi:ATP-binding cassette subfamily B multidrug efflux pump
VVDGTRALIRNADLRSLPAAEARSLRLRDLAYVSERAFILLIVLALVLVSTFVQAFASSLIGQRVMKDLRMELFRHVSTRSLAFLSRQPVGRLATRLTSDVETINQFFTDVIVAFLKDASLMAGVLVVLLAMDARLALVALLTLPPVLVATVVSRGRARDAFRRQRQWVSKVNSYIAERLAGISIVQLFVREEASRREFEAHDRELLKASLGEMYVYATFRPLVDLLANISTAIVIWYGAKLLSVELLSLGTLIAFVNLIRMFYSPVMDISEKFTLLQSAMAGGERVFGLLDAPDTIPDSGTLPMPAAVRGHIEFDHVSFAYKEGEWILHDLSFTVEPGEMVAIVGPTGAGKTTIANLITRLWDIQKGAIRIDGFDVRDLSLPGLRRAVQPVLQDVFLFSGTIEENIRLGEEVSVERMITAAGAVHADEFVDRLPAGYSSQLSEGATNISQGQRQILSFARVLAHDPSIIILDEATSSVDTETERMIQRGLEALLEGRTSVVIAHRLSTIRHADRILVLSEGRVAESGRHAELLAKKGLYWNLYRLQYGGGRAEGSVG